MNLYIESSALLAWLFREPKVSRVDEAIDQAGTVVISDLTLVECNRAIHRQTALGRITAEAGARLATDLSLESTSWIVLEFTSKIVERASDRFPDEPIRALDALHVAFALSAKLELDGISLLTLDDRVRRVGKSVGLDILPV